MKTPSFKTLEGREAVAHAARVLGGVLLELPKDYAVLLELAHQKDHRPSQAFHVAVEDPIDLVPFGAQEVPLIASGSAQEAADMGIVASLLAREIGGPVIHFFDRRWVGAELAKIDILEDDTLRRLARSDITPPGRSIREAFEQVCMRLKEVTGRAYGPYDYAGPAEPERATVTLGTWPAIDGKDGLVRVRLWKPFDMRRFLEMFPSSVKALAVAKALQPDVLSAIHQGIVEGWSWFVSPPPIRAFDPSAVPEEASEDVCEVLIRVNPASAAIATSVRELIENIALHSPSDFQAYTLPDDGTTIHLRIGLRPLTKRGPVTKPDVALILEKGLLTVSGSEFPERSIDIASIAQDAGPGDFSGPVLVSCLLSLVDPEKWFGLSERGIHEILSEAVQDRWGDFSHAIVAAHRRALDGAREALRGTPLSFPTHAVQKPSPIIPSNTAKLASEYLGFRLSSPLVASVPIDADEEERSALASAPVGAVFFGPVDEEDLDREAWKAFETLSRGAGRPDSKTCPPLERYLDLLRRWKSAVEVPVVAGLSVVSEKNWLSMAFSLEQAGADAVELFLRAPEEGGPDDPLRLVSLVATALKIPVAIRVTPALVRLCDDLDRLAEAGAKGLVLFQSPRGRILHPDDLEPREEVLLAGPEVFRLALPVITRISEVSWPLPLSLAAAGPISASGDALRAVLAGARAVYVTADTDELRRLEETLQGWMKAKGFESLDDAQRIIDRGQPKRSVVE